MSGRVSPTILKSDHAEEHHEFIQYAVTVLPPHTPLGWIFTLTADYLHAIAHYPGAVDTAAETMVRFWNTHPESRSPANEEELRSYLALLDEHPDSERIPSISAQMQPVDEHCTQPYNGG